MDLMKEMEPATSNQRSTMSSNSGGDGVRRRRRRPRPTRAITRSRADRKYCSVLNKPATTTTTGSMVVQWLTIGLLAILATSFLFLFSKAQVDSSSSSSSSLPAPPASPASTIIPGAADELATGSSEAPMTILPPPHLRPQVSVNIRDWTKRLGEEIGLVSNRTNCLRKIEHYFEDKAEFQPLDPAKIRDEILIQIQSLLAQHQAALGAIVSEAERLAAAHTFVKNLTINYTDVHRLRNELEPTPPVVDQLGSTVEASPGSLANNQDRGPQFTSINGGTPVPGPPEWQTPIKSIVMQTNKNFGNLPVNISMSAVHLPLPIYPGLPEIMNGIAWTERLDTVFKRNLLNYMHVHYQYYGDHLGFMRTFPAHKWRIPRTEPDLFDARTRPWYVAGASSPKDIVILVDTSGSMTGLRREIAKGVVFEILDSLTHNDYFNVMRFAESVTPVGFPKCNLRTPKLSPYLRNHCPLEGAPGSGGGGRGSLENKREETECLNFRKQQESRGQYLRDHPDVVLGKNGSYLTDELYEKSVGNITNDISDAYLLPATSRNVRYLKTNFTMPTAGIANFTRALISAFELLNSYNRTNDMGAQCNKAIMLITDGAIKSHDEIFNRFNYPNSPVRVFTYMIGREVGDITATKAMACNNRGYYTHVINLSEVREQVQKYLPVMARPLVLGKHHPVTWTQAYGDETYQVLTDWVLETKRRERARIMLMEERERLNEANSTEVINIELTNIPEYDELPLVDEELRNRVICEDHEQVSAEDQQMMDQSMEDELDPLGYNELGCHWSSRKADLLTSVVKPVYDNRNTTIYFQRLLHKNIWIDQPTHVRNAQLLGVAAVDLRLADIMRLAPSHLLGPNGYPILVGHNGFVMQHPDLRALLEDPFDKQSKLLKPYFNSVDLTHIEQVQHKNDSDPIKSRLEDTRLLKLREATVRRQSGVEYITVKRAVDCRRRPHIRNQAFYYGPVKDTPFSLILALPHNYGLNRLKARLDLNKHTPTFFKPSAYDMWTVHPEFKYCEGPPLAKSSNSSVATIMEVMNAVEAGSAGGIVYDSLATSVPGPAEPRHAQRIVCDKDLFPALLFDAAATYERPDLFCSSGNSGGGGGGQGGGGFSVPGCERSSMPFARFLGSSNNNNDDELCEARDAGEMRSKLANIYGLKISYLATRSGLTRVKVFDLSPRTKKLADLFIQRHNRAVDEAWYSRTVDWNMRFDESATIISVPYNAYVRLVAKLRQRITQRHPAINTTRANCDPMLYNEEGELDVSQTSANTTIGGATTGAGSGAGSELPVPVTPLAPSTDGETSSSTSTAGSPPPVESVANSGQQNDEAVTIEGEPTTGAPEPEEPALPMINYNNYSTYDFLDLLANSSVHVSATQSVIINKGTKERSPVAVTGLLYDYATFARRFLNSTSLQIRTLDRPGGPDGGLDSLGLPPDSSDPRVLLRTEVRVDICPGGECPTKCGHRNDTIDCLLVDNNGFIVVGEELVHIGRHLNDYDDRLMQSLIERRLFHPIHMVDYQAICTRTNDQVQQDLAGSGQFNLGRGAPISGSSGSSPASSALLPSGGGGAGLSLARWAQLGQALASNLATSALWIWSMALALLASQQIPSDLSQAAVEWRLLGDEMQALRSPVVDAQSAVANQSLLALLPNKTYLRACEKPLTLYETRPIDPSKLSREAPEYFVTRCGCSGWYVHEPVPHTNLIMLVVNITSACRRCDPPPQSGASAASGASGAASVGPNGFVPVVLGPAELAQAPNAFATAAPGPAPSNPMGNKTAEEQVCAMLERDSQLYVKRPESCHASHPEEAQIKICGGAGARWPSRLLLLSSLALGLWLAATSARPSHHPAWT